MAKNESHSMTAFAVDAHAMTELYEQLDVLPLQELEADRLDAVNRFRVAFRQHRLTGMPDAFAAAADAYFAAVTAVASGPLVPDARDEPIEAESPAAGPSSQASVKQTGLSNGSDELPEYLKTMSLQAAAVVFRNVLHGG